MRRSIVGIAAMLVFAAAAPGRADRPDPHLTPGVTVRVTVAKVCTPGYSKTVRNVPDAVKRRVYQTYGITTHKPGDYEVDHLISLELGGANEIGNLWPQSYRGPRNAHQKDALENRLHWLVCHGQLSLQEAQRAIVSDWVAAYQTFILDAPPKGTR